MLDGDGKEKTPYIISLESYFSYSATFNAFIIKTEKYTLVLKLID